MKLCLVSSFLVVFLCASFVEAEQAISNRVNPSFNTQVSTSGCPKALIHLAKEDGDDTFFGLLNNYRDICTKAISDRNTLSKASDLQIQLQGRFSNLSSSAHQKVKACISKNTKEEGYLTAKYYYELDRLQQGSKELLYQIAAIDKLTADTVLDEIECPHGYLAEANAFCKNLKSKCKTKDEKAFDDLLSTTANAYEVKRKYEKLQKELMYAKGAESSQEILALEKLTREINELKPAYEKALLDAPWIDGKAFRNIMNDYHAKGETKISAWNAEEKAKGLKGAAEKAFRQQLQENRKALQAQLQEFNGVVECFSGSTNKTCNGKEIRQVLSQTPTTEILHSNNRQWNDTNQYLDVQQCVHDGKLDQDATGEVLTNASTAAALTVATGGGSIAFGSARMAHALRAGKDLQAAYRFQRTGMLTQAGKNITRVELGAAVGDSAYAVNEGIQSANQCSKQAQKLEQAIAQEQKNICPSYNSESLQVKNEYDECVFNATLQSLSALPVVAAIAGPLRRVAAASGRSTAKVVPNQNLKNKVQDLRKLSRKERIQQASENANLSINQRVDRIYRETGVRLTSEQIKSLEAAHAVGKKGRGFGTYTQREIAEKDRILATTVKDPELRKYLIRRGFAGTVPDDFDHYVRMSRSAQRSEADLMQERNRLSAELDVNELKLEKSDLSVEDRVKIQNQIQDLQSQVDDVTAGLHGKRGGHTAILDEVQSRIGRQTMSLDSATTPVGRDKVLHARQSSLRSEADIFASQKSYDQSLTSLQLARGDLDDLSNIQNLNKNQKMDALRTYHMSGEKLDSDNYYKLITDVASDPNLGTRIEDYKRLSFPAASSSSTDKTWNQLREYQERKTQLEIMRRNFELKSKGRWFGPENSKAEFESYNKAFTQFEDEVIEMRERLTGTISPKVARQLGL